MKKITLLIIVFILVLTSCSNKENSTADNNSSPKDDLSSNQIDISVILEVDSGQVYAEEQANHTNTISSSPQKSVDKSVSVDKSLDVNNTTLTIKYQETLYYPVSDKRVHKYFVDNDEKKTVLIDENGKINALLYTYTTINISKNASTDEVIEPLKAELSKVLDISFYKNVQTSSVPYSDSAFGLYSYVFYNEKNGYMTDYLKVSVSDDGGVFGLSINNLPESDFNVNISKEKEDEAIQAKMKDIYNTDKTEYKTYKSIFDPCIVVYEDQLYVQYFVSATYTHSEHGETNSFINTILIPLDLISE